MLVRGWPCRQNRSRRTGSVRASGTVSDAVSTDTGLRPVSSRRWVFASLANRNYRRYFAGQAVSLPGTWMQSIAQSWLVVQLTGSGTMLGLLVAVQTLPVLLLTPYAGVLVDRADKRRLLLGTQSAQALLALGLGTLTVIHAVRLWMVFMLAAGLGLVTSLDNPGRQAFVVEMVGTADLLNAVSLNSLLVNAARGRPRDSRRPHPARRSRRLLPDQRCNVCGDHRRAGQYEPLPVAPRSTGTAHRRAAG